MHQIGKREFLTGLGLGLGIATASPALAQSMMRATSKMTRKPAAAPARKDLPNRMAKTTRLFKAPALYPNGLAVASEGLWVQQQHLTEAEAEAAGVHWPASGKESLWLMDWTGKLLKTLYSNASNGSGLAVGGGALWAMANTSDADSGIHQVDLASGKQVAHRQLPLSPNNNSGGIHGAQWHDGKLWIVNNRMHSIIRMNPRNWTAEMQIPIATPPGLTRYHDITFDKDGTLLQVLANESSSFHDSKAALVRYDASTGQPLETITLVDNSCDPHGLELHNGRLISCDAGYHPNWNRNISPTSGWIFSIDPI